MTNAELKFSRKNQAIERVWANVWFEREKGEVRVHVGVASDSAETLEVGFEVWLGAAGGAEFTAEQNYPAGTYWKFPPADQTEGYLPKGGWLERHRVIDNPLLLTNNFHVAVQINFTHSGLRPPPWSTGKEVVGGG